MADEKTENRSLIVSKILGQEVQPNLLRCCPTMDLIATVTRDERVEVFRLSGQRAFSVQRKKKDTKVTSLCWKYNGQYIAVSWSDGEVDVVSAETGNALQNFRQFTGSNAAMCLGWGMSLLDVEAARARTKTNGESLGSYSKKQAVSADDFLDREPDLEKLDLPAELPDQLATFDATELMPKLPTLAVLPSSAYKNGQLSLAELFASQTLLDAALHRGSSRELNALNTFLLSNASGVVQLIVYDSLSIGSIALPGLAVDDKIEYIKHYSHPLAHCHVVLSKIQQGTKNPVLALVPISLRFLRKAGKNISFIDYKTAQLDTLVKYVGESILAIYHHWKTSHDLPSRFQANISESLAEKNEPSLSESLYQLAATGYCSETMNEWLKDELAERGHKRWDQAITQGHTKIIELLQENLLPALDRCSVVLANLQGLAQYYEHSPAFDVPISSFLIIQDIIKCMRLLAHHMLLFASVEQKRFATFSKWLRHQIEVQTADAATQAGQELVERDAGVDHTLVLSYIESGLDGSKLDAFLCPPADAPTILIKSDIYEVVRQALEAFKNGEAHKKEMLKLLAYHNEWCQHNTALIEQITEWQRANALIPGAIVLENGDVEVASCDMRMAVSDSTPAGALWTYVATTTKQEPAVVTVRRVLHSDILDDMNDGIQEVEAFLVKLPGQVKDLQFVDDHELLVLLKTATASRLVAIPIIDKDSSKVGPAFSRIDGSAKSMEWPSGSAPQVNGHIELTDDALEIATRMSFTDEDGFQPVRIEVNGRQGRRLCVLLGSDLRQFRVFDLDCLGADTAAGAAATDRP
ncbi:hypothetical protein BT63DRAFT_382837 [Microthyrium microscopicum]|uniref:Anaphase-promoting complex subunit 4 n=1 Tax=Microthyrium microscopicum TaxID=703497 RepID=A0A6A6UMP1_9PEZI|nr:hypothetical protein BT63DRAFT_382837 [Microthyrium microscopicum]